MIISYLFPHVIPNSLDFECEIPEEMKKCSEWQTKDLFCMMKRYTVNKDGRLIYHDVRYETVPKEERPYYGKPEWEEAPFYQWAGSVRSVPHGDVDVDYHGDVFVSALDVRRDLVVYRLRFTHGTLESITKIEQEKL